MEVKIRNLTKIFTNKKKEETVAVNDMSFDIPDGKLVGLLGPSGCGKSTTLYMIAGLHKPSSGNIYFGEEDVTNVPPENRGIGLVFQNYALYPHLSVRQNIQFPLDNVKIEETVEEEKTEGDDAKGQQKVSIRKLTKAEKNEIVLQMARLVDIEQYLDRKPKELSGGQQQRVAIARALAKNPQVLLLDEPLSNLDARLRLQTREEIKRIQKETGVTTIFVTHDQEEAMSISDFIVIMKDGVIQQIGEPQHVYDEPANLFVAKFLGSPAINIFKGKLVSGELFVNTVSLGKVTKEKLSGEVLVGVRPESFEIDPDGVTINVDYVEHIGRDISIIGKVSYQPESHLKILIPSELRKQVDGKANVKVGFKKFYVFTSEGRRIK